MGCKMDSSDTTLPPHLHALLPFNPHVASFTCQIEATKVPLVDAQANDWFLEARALEDPLVYDYIDYKKVVRLTRQAADRHHWKAMLNLASLYIEGHDHPNGKAEAVALVNQAIDLGIPAAYDRMGTYQLNGTGSYSGSGDTYALFQRAAEMGNPYSMAFLGEKMDAGADGLKTGYWGNIPVAIKMFECALAQGHGPAAEDLEYMYAVPRGLDGAELGQPTPGTLDNVMRAMQEGVKGGSKMAAISLSIEFGRPMNPPGYIYVPFLDKARSERYSLISSALSFNPDRRFPNLDKILPLPPTELPAWDGTRESLLAAAMAVIPKPAVPTPTEASLRKDRYFLDSVYTFLPTTETTNSKTAPVSSYWKPAATNASPQLRAFLDTIHPALYQKGEAFEPLPYPGSLQKAETAQVVWQRVLTTRNNGGAAEPRAVATLAREVQRIEPGITNDGQGACPVTGTWQPWLAPGHPLEQAVNQPWRQRWLTAGQPFPDPKRDWMLTLGSGELTWHLIEAEVSTSR